MKVDLEKLKYHLSLVIDCGGDPVYEQLKSIVEELEAGRELRTELNDAECEHTHRAIFSPKFDAILQKYDDVTGYKID